MNFYRIIFSKDPGSEKYYQIVKNPGVCFDCHGSKDAPIPQWGHYPEWPNFLGSFDDLLLPDGDQRKTISRAEDTCAGSLTVNVAKKTKDESIVVRDNRAQWIVHPRYKYFFANDRGNELYPYSKNFRGKFSLRPNLRLGTLLHRRFIKDRLKRLRRKNVKLYDYSFPLYLFDHFECSNILPESKKLRNDIVAKVSGLFSEAAFTQDGDWQSEFLLSFDETFFDLDFNPGGRASSTGFFSGFLNSKQLIATYLYRSTVLKRPGINAFVEEADINGCYPGYGPAYAKFIVKLGGKISPKAAQLPNLCQSLAQIYVPK